MGFDYSNIQATAVAQIADKGRLVDIVYKTEGSYNPTSDSVSGNSENTVSVRALVTEFNRRDVAASLVQAGDLQVIIAASGIDKPKTNDILVDGDDFTIITVSEIKPGGAAILYKLQVRKG